MSKLKIGAINYINTLPLYAGFHHGNIPCVGELTYEIPSAINARLRAGELDVAFISSAEFLNNRHCYELIPDFCVGARERVLSVCLFSRYPVDDLDGKTIGLTDHSATSAKLVEVLCRHYWHVAPHFTQFSDANDVIDFDAFLVIGDRCLQNQSLEYTTIDLAEAWWQATGQPFVFAVFAANRASMETKGEAISQYQQQLRETLLWADQNPRVIEELALEKCPVPPSLITEYFKVLEYRMTPDMQQGLSAFEALLQK